MRIGPYVALTVHRTPAGDPCNVRVRKERADSIGWSAAFPTETQSEQAFREAQGRSGIRFRRRKPHRGGTACRLWLEENPYGRGIHREFRFRVVGPWCRLALLKLVAATGPQVHAVNIGSHGYHISQAAQLALVANL